MAEYVSGTRKLKKGERVAFNPFRPASQGEIVKEADVEKKFQADKKKSAEAQAKGGTFKSVATTIGTGINNALGIKPPERTQAPSYYMPDKKPTPTRTPKGPKGPRAPATAAPKTAVATKSVVATAPRRATISNVNSSDRGGYTTSRPDTGWGPGNTNPYAKQGSSRLAKKGVTVKKAGGSGKAFKGLKWFNGKD